jgi:hypothetical protein
MTCRKDSGSTGSRTDGMAGRRGCGPTGWRADGKQVLGNQDGGPTGCRAEGMADWMLD